MPWNGSGTFSRLYNFVADAAAGIKILASKQDAEWSNVVTGLNNVLCRDGQNTPSANLNMGGFRLTGLADGVALTDAATVGQISGGSDSGEWKPEVAGITYISATSFKTLAGDTTAIYTPGRRVKSTNTGGTIYSTILSSSYSAPDTTVVVLNDSGSLDSGLSAVSYGRISSVNTSAPYFTNFAVTQTNTNIPSATTTIVCQSATPYGDKLSEWTNGATGRFTAKVAGEYFIQATGVLLQSGANVTLGDVFTMSIYKNGSSSSIIASISWPYATGAASRQFALSGGGHVTLAASDYIDVRITAPTYTTATAIFYGRLSARRLG